MLWPNRILLLLHCRDPFGFTKINSKQTKSSISKSLLQQQNWRKRFRNQVFWGRIKDYLELRGENKNAAGSSTGVNLQNNFKKKGETNKIHKNLNLVAITIRVTMGNEIKKKIVVPGKLRHPCKIIRKQKLMRRVRDKERERYRADEDIERTMMILLLLRFFSLLSIKIFSGNNIEKKTRERERGNEKERVTIGSPLKWAVLNLESRHFRSLSAFLPFSPFFPSNFLFFFF